MKSKSQAYHYGREEQKRANDIAGKYPWLGPNPIYLPDKHKNTKRKRK